MLGLRAAPVMLLVAACASPAPDPGPPPAMAPSEPIAEADPAVRHAEVVALPARLRVRWEGDGVEYGVDQASLQDVTLDVGHKMVLGMRIVWTARRGDGEPEWLSLEMGGLSFRNSASTWDGASEGCVIEAAMEVFETDIPPHHFWAPKRGRYRVIWRKTLRAEVPARP